MMGNQNTKELILIVDDNEFSAIHIEELLSAKYQVEAVLDGESGVSSSLTLKPSLILMDVEMPGIDGYETCRRIKINPETHEIPVLFVSAKADVSDRLSGYQAGGDDYITKPFTPSELEHKVEVLLRNVKKNRTLSHQVKDASSAAMTAMSTVGDVGIIMRFLNEMVSCLDYHSVTSLVLKTLESFGLEGSLQIRSGDVLVSRSSEGICSPLEESVLSNMASCARIVDLGQRSAFNFPAVSIIVKNMPKEVPEQYGRVKDNVATIAESVDVHVQSLQVVDTALQRGDILLGMLQSTVGNLKDIDRKYRHQRVESSQILNDLIHQIEDSFVHLGLTEGQEHFLQTTLRNAVDQAQALYQEEIEVDQAMKSLNSDLDSFLSQEITSLHENAVEEEQRIELF